MNKITSGRLPNSSCIKCDKKIDAAIVLGNQQAFPTAGDISICTYCGEIMIYDDRLILTQPTAGEMLELESDTELWQLILKAQKFIRSQTAKAIFGSVRN